MSRRHRRRRNRLMRQFNVELYLERGHSRAARLEAQRLREENSSLRSKLDEQEKEFGVLRGINDKEFRVFRTEVQRVEERGYGRELMQIGIQFDLEAVQRGLRVASMDGPIAVFRHIEFELERARRQIMDKVIGEMRASHGFTGRHPV